MDFFEKECLLRQINCDKFTAKSDDGRHCFLDRISSHSSSNSGVSPIMDLPPEVLHLILRNLKFENIAKLRLVSIRNYICTSDTCHIL